MYFCNVDFFFLQPCDPNALDISPPTFDHFQSATVASLSNVRAPVLAHGAQGHNHIASPSFSVLV